MYKIILYQKECEILINEHLFCHFRGLMMVEFQISSTIEQLKICLRKFKFSFLNFKFNFSQ